MSTEEINTRNELARDIPKWTDLPFGGVNDYVRLDANAAYAIADVLIEKGYSKPRQVSTVEELDALPDGSIVQEYDGFLRYKYRWGGWALCVPGASEDASDTIILPATVLHEGGSL